MKKYTYLLIAAICAALASCSDFTGTFRVPIADAHGRTVGYVDFNSAK